MRLTWLEPPFSVCRLPARAAIPAWSAQPGAFFCVVRTTDELSIVCEQRLVPAGVQAEGPFLALKVAGPLHFSLVGVLASLLDPIAQAGISVFVVSTFDTDYLLVSTVDRDSATKVLIAAGHSVE